MTNHPSYGRGDPGDETPAAGTPCYRIIRNGKLYARRETLGAARALVRRTQSYAGHHDRWSIMDGRKVVDRIAAD
jgi:hypothetical protein